MSEKCESFYREAVKLKEKLGSENLDDSGKQTLWSKLEQLVTKLYSTHAAIIQIVEDVEVSSRHSATHGNRKESSIANSQSSRRGHGAEMELDNPRDGA